MGKFLVCRIVIRAIVKKLIRGDEPRIRFLYRVLREAFTVEWVLECKLWHF